MAMVNMNGENWETLAAVRMENGIRYLEAKDEDSTEWHVIAAVDTETGKVFYSDPAARTSASAQLIIKGIVDTAKKEHPYSVERLEGILAGVIDYECEEMASGEGTDYAEMNLSAMGFSEEEMRFFGFPERA
ncbi:MAG: hypothetical protein NC489_44770 [Ruminococcus flavefaciens]|nr:hypothetical protein [Ruminococcus flavefaciens]